MLPIGEIDFMAAEQLSPARGSVDIDWTTGELTGWILVPDLQLTSVQVHLNGTRFVADPASNAGIAEAFPRMPHAAESGFRVNLSADQLAQLEDAGMSPCLLIGFQGDAPVVRLRMLLFLDRLMPDVPVPPAELIEKTQGNADPRNYKVLGYRYYWQFKEALGRHRAPETSWRLLDFGCGSGRLSAHFLADPAGFQVSGCDLDSDAIAFCRASLPRGEFSLVRTLPLPYSDGAFDMAVSLAVFPAFGPDDQEAVLEELRRVIVPGGLLVTSIQGRVTASCVYPPRVVPDVLQDGIFDRRRYDQLGSAVDKGVYQGVFQTAECGL